MALQISDWDTHFESSDSRKVKRLAWVRIPNKHDGGAYCDLLDHPDGTGHLGAWLLIVQVASKMPCRGLLVDERGRSLDAKDIARRTRGDWEVIQDAIPRLVEIGWLQVVDIEEDTQAHPACRDGVLAHPDGSGDAPEKTPVHPDLPPPRGEERRGRGEKTTTTNDGQPVTSQPAPGVRSSPSSDLDQEDPGQQIHDAMDDIETRAPPTAMARASPHADHDWHMWRQRHPQIFVARTGDDGDLRSWQALYERMTGADGAEVEFIGDPMSTAYDRILASKREERPDAKVFLADMLAMYEDWREIIRSQKEASNA